jgi:hypothetical protein
MFSPGGAEIPVEVVIVNKLFHCSVALVGVILDGQNSNE